MKFYKKYLMGFLLLYVSFFSTQVYAESEFEVTIDSLIGNINNYPLPVTGNTDLEPYANLILQLVNEIIGSKWCDQKNLAKGFANATASSGYTTSLKGYYGYDIAAFAYGASFSAQALTYDLSQFKDIDKTLVEEGDVKIGLGMGSAFNAGYNLQNLFRVMNIHSDNDLYINAKFMIWNEDLNEINIGSKTFGFELAYQLIKPNSLAYGSFLWRGLYISSGLIYNYNKADIIVDALSDQIISINSDYRLAIDPKLNLRLESNTKTVPVDITTSVRILYVLNLTFGVGMDYNTGNTDIIIKQKNNIILQNSSGDHIADIGSISIKSSTKDGSPEQFRSHCMVGAGFTIGPVLIDATLMYHFITGISAGFSAGFTY